MPTGSINQPIEHTFAAPPFKEASVVDAMRMGIVTCSPDTTAREVARTMATYRIHSVVVSEMDGPSRWASSPMSTWPPPRLPAPRAA